MSGNGNQVPLAQGQRGPGPLSHGCVGHGGGADSRAGAGATGLPSGLALQPPHHLARLGLQPLSSVSLHLLNNSSRHSHSLKHEHSSSRYTNSATYTPSHHYRLLAQARPECYHPGGGGYMGGGQGAGQGAGQATMRVQQPQQQQQQQDMSKTSMPTHNFVPTQSQSQQARAQYPSFQYRAAQHGTRPGNHPRQQQQFIQGATPAGSPVMYPALVFQPQLGMPSTYQQPRSQAFYPIMAPLHYNYATNPQSHTSPYYPSFVSSGGQQLPAPNLSASAPGRGGGAMVGPPGAPAAPTAPAPTLPHPAQPPAHMHPSMRSAPPKHSRRLQIIDPATNQDILSEISNDSQYVSGDSSERQTPQPETTNHIAEEFTRMVNEVANQPSDGTIKSHFHTSKNTESAPTTNAPNTHTQTNAISSINNNIVKSDILTKENKTLGPDVAVEPSETPVVSAISDSPVIVPKLPTNIKQIQKISEPNVQPLVLDTNKNLPATKQHKQAKIKPVVPQVDEVEKPESEGFVAAAAVAMAPPPAIVTAPTSAPMPAPAPQPQRVPRDRLRSEEKHKPREPEKGKSSSPEASTKPNGPVQPSSCLIDKVDDIVPEIVKPLTSQTSPVTNTESPDPPIVLKASSPVLETESTIPIESVEPKSETITKKETGTAAIVPTPTELLSASIEKLSKETIQVETDSKEASSAIEAQAKLTQSIASCLRGNQPESKMKDVKVNNKSADPDAANGNNLETASNRTDNDNEDVNKNEKAVKNSKNMNKKAAKNATESPEKDTESYENGKDETDKVTIEQEEVLPPSADEDAQKPDPPAVDIVIEPAVDEALKSPPVFTPKYKYNDEQWSPINTSGKKCYDLGLLKQIRDDPLSKNKPDVPLLETCKVVRETMAFTPISRPINDSLFPSFAKNAGGVSRNTPRDPKKDGRSIAPSGKGSVKLTPSTSGGGGGGGGHKPVIHVSLSLREDVKLNETENAWKPTRYKKDSVGEEEFKTQELYKKFRGILNKLTPQKFDTLLERVKKLEINNQKRLEGVIDLVFEKAIEEPNFSEAYANMCNKLNNLKVPADNPKSPDQCVNFRGLILSKCQNQFVTNKVDDVVIKLEKELNECTDRVKRKELQAMLAEENRRVRMRSVGNVRFIGELYKLKMLTSKIMVFCMNHLIEKLEEEKLECLCKLLTTIGEQVEGEVRDQLDAVFKKMQDIVERKQNKISSRVRFMLQDVIELRRRKWVTKSVVDSQPKMMDQIQKEAEQQQRHIELMNSAPMGGFRGGRDEGGRGKRNDGRNRQSGGGNANNFMDNNWKTTTRNTYSVDTTKFKAVSNKNLSNIKLAPTNSSWNYGSGTKNTAQAATNSLNSLPTATTNMYSVLAENMATDPTSLRGSKDATPGYHSKGASIERSTFNSRADFSSGSGSRSGSMGGPRSNSGTRAAAATPPAPAPSPPAAPAAPAAAAPPASVPQEPLPDAKKKSVKAMVDLLLINPDDDEMVSEVKALFPPQYHSGVVTEMINIALEKSSKDFANIAKSLLHLVSTGTISAANFLAGLKEVFEFAPDLYIDIPLLYDYLGKLIAPQIEKKHVTFVQILRLCEFIVTSNHGHLFLRAVFNCLKDSMGPTFVKNKWQESGLQLKHWMEEDQVPKFIEENKLEFLESSGNANEDTKKILTPAETHSKLLQLMNSFESLECIKGWVQDNLGKCSNEEWFMRSLMQAICEHALFGPEGRTVPHFMQDRMSKYSGLINEFGESRAVREASCLVGIQQLVHRLEHPQGLSLDIFQCLHESYAISLEGFLAWEKSDKELEGKGVMLKALTSFFTNIKEADNEDSCSED